MTFKSETVAWYLTADPSVVFQFWDDNGESVEVEITKPSDLATLLSLTMDAADVLDCAVEQGYLHAVAEYELEGGGEDSVDRMSSSEDVWESLENAEDSDETED